jgi:hypothetical protein
MATPSNTPPKKHSRFYWKPLAFALGVGMFCVLATLSFDNRSQSPASTETPNATVTISVPTNSVAPAGTVKVEIPGRIVDKLGPSHDSGVTGTAAVALIALLGSSLAAVLAYLATRDKNKNDRTISDEIRKQATDDRTETRRQEIRDRSRKACIDVLRAGQQVTGASRLLWVSIHNDDPSDRIEKNSEDLKTVVQGWQAVAEVLSLSIPPTAESAFDGYKNALNEYVTCATRWKGNFDWLAKPEAMRSAAQAPKEIPSPEQSNDLHKEVIASRETFLEATSPLFLENAFTPKT